MISELMSKSWIDGKVAILQEHLEIEACEIHGVICGLIAGGATDNPTEFMPKIYNIINSGEPLSAELKDWILEFYKIIRTQYHDMETLEFPFEEDLTDQESSVYFLSLWSEAFLIGFGCEINKEEMNDNTKELIEEISNYTQLEVSDDVDQDEFDEIITLLVEHLKICAMSLYADYGFKTDGKIIIPKEIANNKYTKDGELVIGDEGISLDDLQQ